MKTEKNGKYLEIKNVMLLQLFLLHFHKNKFQMIKQQMHWYK